MAKPKIYQVEQLQTTLGAVNTAITTAHNQANNAYSQANTGGGPKITSLIYPGDDQAANSDGGQTVYIVGSGFASNATVYINGNSVPSVSYISAGNLSISTPALSTGIYPVYVINPADGGTAIRVPGLIISGEPVWNTAAGSLSTSQVIDGAWSYTLSANGDAPITYTLAAGSSLPAGVTLNANGVVSGTISSPPASDTTYTFSVVASDAQNQDSTRQFSVTATVSDVYFANTVLLLHADGTNNGNNHAFVDSSTNNFTINRNGNATQGSFSPFSQTGWSNYFDGTGDYLSLSPNSAFDLGSGNFTLEMWVNQTTIPSGRYIRFFQIGGDSNDLFLVQYDTTSNLMNFAMGNGGGGTSIINSSYVLPANQWVHLAFVREGTGTNQVKFYANGTLIAQGTYSGGMAAGGSVWIGGIGWASTTTYHSTGYISNVRLLKGTALYTSAFTPPTEPLTAITNTSLLTCQSNRFIDKSINNFTVTRNGDVSVQAFSPFRPTDPYVAANVAGSLYVDGTSDNINVASNTAFAFGTDPFTVEMWYYPTAAPDQWDSIFSTGGTSGIFFACRSGFLDWTNNNDNAGTIRSNWPTIGQWNHIVLTQGSGTRAVFINGARTGNSASGFSWGQDGMTFADNTIGYYSGFRIIKGQAIYDPTQTTLTVPTAPPTTTSQGSTNTVFLCNFTNAQIFDQAAKSILETIGDAKVSTAQYKYGSGSMYFDGTGDYIPAYSPNLFVFGTGDFTAEAWVYPTSFPAEAAIITTAHPTDTHGFTINVGTSGNIIFALGSGTGSWTVLATSDAGTLTTNSWQHIALTRSGNVFRIFINGTQTYTVTNSLSLTNVNNRLTVGGRTVGGGQYFNGYIDDVRVTRNFARYTSNFSPAASAFPNK